MERLSGLQSKINSRTIPCPKRHGRSQHVLAVNPSVYCRWSWLDHVSLGLGVLDDEETKERANLAAAMSCSRGPTQSADVRGKLVLNRTPLHVRQPQKFPRLEICLPVEPTGECVTGKRRAQIEFRAIRGFLHEFERQRCAPGWALGYEGIHIGRPSLETPLVSLFIQPAATHSMPSTGTHLASREKRSLPLSLLAVKLRLSATSPI